MHKLALVLACVAYVGHGRRVQISPEELQNGQHAEHTGVGALSTLLLALDPTATFNPSGPAMHFSARTPARQNHLGRSTLLTSMSEKAEVSAADGHEAVPEPLMQMDNLAQKASAAALACYFALISNPYFAAAVDAPASAYSKIDKTGPVGFVATFIEDGIDGAAGILGSHGAAIVLFTAIIRSLTLPLTMTQMTSSAKMQKLRPLQEKITQKFGKGREAERQQYMSKLYTASEVNPLAGCLPAVVQIPVFVSLYRALQNLIAEDKLSEPFLWIPDLEGPVYKKASTETLTWFTSIFSGNPELGWEKSIAFLSVPLILVITQTVSTRLNSPPPPPGQDSDGTQQLFITLIPFVVAFFSLSVPSGLAVYWISNTALTTAATLFVKSTIKDDDFPKEVLKMMRKFDPENTLKLAGAVPKKGFKPKRKKYVPPAAAVNKKANAAAARATEAEPAQANGVPDDSMASAPTAAVATATAERPVVAQGEVDVPYTKKGRRPQQKGKGGKRGKRKRR